MIHLFKPVLRSESTGRSESDQFAVEMYIKIYDELQPVSFSVMCTVGREKSDMKRDMMQQADALLNLTDETRELDTYD